MFKRFVAAGTKYPELKPSSVIFQFFHPGKINQPVDMAQNTRGTHGNIVINVAWEGDAGLLTEAKGAAAAIVSELGEYGEGAVAYGNSGQPFIHPSSIRAQQTAEPSQNRTAGKVIG